MLIKKWGGSILAQTNTKKDSNKTNDRLFTQVDLDYAWRMGYNTGVIVVISELMLEKYPKV